MKTTVTFLLTFTVAACSGSVTTILLSAAACGCGWDPCAGLTTPSILCPGGPAATAAPPADPDAPCWGNPCAADEFGGLLQDVGEHCGGDDHLAPQDAPRCCHGLSCVDAATGAFPGSAVMGVCQRGDGQSWAATCPKGGPWRYQCDGLYTLKSAAMSVETFTGEFTGPPPDQVSAQGGGPVDEDRVRGAVPHDPGGGFHVLLPRSEKLPVRRPGDPPHPRRRVGRWVRGTP